MTSAWRRKKPTRRRSAGVEVLEVRNFLAGDVVISGIIDGPLSGGTPKAVELSVLNDIADLSRYGIGSANNGQGSDGVELQLSGPATQGQFLYVATEVDNFEAYFGFAPHFVSSAANINGDDAIELFYDRTGDGFASPLASDDIVGDVFGEIANDGTGQAWEYRDGWAYRASGTGPDGSAFALGNWTFSGTNALDGESTNATAVDPIPIGTYGTAADAEPPQGIVINEVDSDTPSTDSQEFIELYDGGVGSVPLGGLVVVLFNGNSDASYRAFDLAGHATDSEGFFVLGGAGAPNVDMVIGNTNVLQNGPDAVALFVGALGDFPNGTPLTSTNLMDAVAYGTGDADDAELIAVFGAQIDEDGNGSKDTDSVSRSPDGGGLIAAPATPGLPNAVLLLEPEIDILGNGQSIISSDPTPSVSDGTDFGSAAVATGTVSRSFSIANTNGTANLEIAEIRTEGMHAADFSIGTYSATIGPGEASGFEITFRPRARGLRSAVVTIRSNDADESNYEFAIQGRGIEVATHVVINEVDSDTLGSDTQEFIELYDGGAGNTSLDGLVVVLFNGSSDASYRVFELAGQTTGSDGFFVLGNSSVPNSDFDIGSGVLQNGPDAVALYQGSADDFPQGSPITTADLLDAVVYGTGDADDDDLIAAFGGQIDESANGEKDSDSVSRSPDGTGAFITVPATPGAHNATVEDTKRPQIVVLGNGTAIVLGDDTPNSDDGTDFGVVDSNGDEARQSFTIDNSAGQAALKISDVVVAGPHPADFVVTRFPTSIPPGESSAFEVAFRPQANGLRAATISLFSNDARRSPYDFTVQGKGITVATHVVINEVDADTPGKDTAEFVELYDGGAGRTPLDGLVIVFFNGNSDTSYQAVDLLGYATDVNGLFVLGGRDAPQLDLEIGSSNVLQNGPDAVALYVGRKADFPDGSPITTDRLVDAIVYGAAEHIDSELTAAFGTQFDESAYAAPDLDSIARSPDGQSLTTKPATPGGANGIVIQTGEIGVLGQGRSLANGSRKPSLEDGTDFGSVQVNAEIYNNTFTITNRGRDDLELGRVSIVGGSDFRVSHPVDTRLAYRQETTFLVVFAPTRGGSQTAIVSIDSRDPDGGTFTFQVAGTVAGTPSADLEILGNGHAISEGDRSPSKRDGTHFGLVPIHVSTSTIFELQNLGTQFLSIDAMTIEGLHAEEFEVQTFPQYVNEGESKFFEVSFTPQELGERFARLTVLSNDANDPLFGFDIQGSGVSRLPEFVINEINVDTPDENREFVELYDGGIGSVPLDGLTLLLFNGNNLQSYRQFPLDGFLTGPDGFFVIGDADTPNVDFTPPGFDGLNDDSPASHIQNGEDAIALFLGGPFPSGSPPPTTGLVHAIVYETGSDTDTDLRQAFGGGEVFDEQGPGNQDDVSLVRTAEGRFVTQAPSPGGHPAATPATRDDWTSRRDRGQPRPEPS